MIPISPNSVIPKEKMVTQRLGKATKIVAPAAPASQYVTYVQTCPLTDQGREKNSYITVFIIWNILQARPKGFDFSQGSRDLESE